MKIGAQILRRRYCRMDELAGIFEWMGARGSTAIFPKHKSAQGNIAENVRRNLTSSWQRHDVSMTCIWHFYGADVTLLEQGVAAGCEEGSLYWIP
jgi:hypothetical protein